MTEIGVVIGTRPEAIKLAPVVLALRARGIDCCVCVTAQHRGLLDQVLHVFGIVPDVDLNLMQANQSLAGLTARALDRLDAYLSDRRPDLVLVQGDTTTVLCASLASFYHRIPVGHVEAGLRTGDMYSPWPEEVNRVLTARLSALHFAPTSRAADNLRREGVEESRILVTGNTGIDALLWMTEQNRRNPGRFADRPWQRWPGRVVAVTAHRRENFGPPFEQVCQAIADLAADFPDTLFVYPVHPNPNVLEPARQILANRNDARLAGRNVALIDPLAYPEFVDLMSRSTLILTDSGGVQEEAPSLGKPVLVLRETTERPEAVDAGTVLMVGPHRERLIGEVTRLLTDSSACFAMSRTHNPYGDGKAAARIVDACAEFLRSAKIAGASRSQ